MTPGERGFLLLTGKLGNPERKALTAAQLRRLSQLVRGAEAPQEDRELLPEDLVRLGYGREMACRITGLLAEEALLEHYLLRGRKLGCTPVSRVSEGYPRRLRQGLGPEAPGCLWAKGDISLLDTPMAALVGSRDLREANRKFAERVGYQAAMQGYTLVSGNARGADRTAQNACLQAGGSVICVVADELAKQPPASRVLYLSEDGFDECFSAQRALSRNRVIHALGRMVFVAQCSQGKGGTWDGTVKNLRFGWSPVFGFGDGSSAMTMLGQMGAELIGIRELEDMGQLTQREYCLFDR